MTAIKKNPSGFVHIFKVSEM